MLATDFNPWLISGSGGDLEVERAPLEWGWPVEVAWSDGRFYALAPEVGLYGRSGGAWATVWLGEPGEHTSALSAAPGGGLVFVASRIGAEGARERRIVHLAGEEVTEISVPTAIQSTYLRRLREGPFVVAGETGVHVWDGDWGPVPGGDVQAVWLEELTDGTLLTLSWPDGIVEGTIAGLAPVTGLPFVSLGRLSATGDEAWIARYEAPTGATVVLRRSEAVWSVLPPVQGAIFDVEGVQGGALAVGGVNDGVNGPFVARFDGSSWSTLWRAVELASGGAATGLQGSMWSGSSGDSSVAEWSGGVPRRVPRPTGDFGPIRALLPYDSDGAFAVARDEVLRVHAGEAVPLLSDDRVGGLTGGWAFGPRKVWVTGRYNDLPAVLVYEGATWTGLPTPPLGLDAVDGVVARSESEAWFLAHEDVSYDERVNYVLRWDGDGWEALDVAVPPGGARLMFDANQDVVVATDGPTLRLEGDELVPADDLPEALAGLAFGTATLASGILDGVSGVYLQEGDAWTLALGTEPPAPIAVTGDDVLVAGAVMAHTGICR